MDRMKLLNLGFIILFVLLIQNLEGQEYTIKNLDKTDSEIKALEAEAFDLTSLLPKNYVLDGTIDYTDFIQKGLINYRSVKMPNFPILINPKGLKIYSKSDIFFQKNSSIIMLANNLPAYVMLDITGQDNIKVYNANLLGDRFRHKDVKGEWGIGIRIIDSHNIVFYNPRIKNTWGDGVYIGDNNSNDIYNKNIFIFNCFIDRSRRNGISITSAKNVYIQGGKIFGSNGTMPMSGLDIEPNNILNTINNININNLKTSNEGSGIIISLGKFKEKIGEVNIAIKGHVDDGGYSGLYIPNLDVGNGQLQGAISIRNSTYMNNKANGIFIENYAALNTPKILISDSKIINSNCSDQKSPRWGAGISFGRDSRRPIFNQMGNLLISNIHIVDNRKKRLMRAGVSFVDDNGQDFLNVNLKGLVIQGITSPNQFFLKKGVTVSR